MAVAFKFGKSILIVKLAIKTLIYHQIYFKLTNIISDANFINII